MGASEGPYGRTQSATKLCQHPSIHPICLGEFSGGPGEVSRLPRVDHAYWQLCIRKSLGDLDLIPSSCFENYPTGLKPDHLVDELRELFSFVCHPILFARRRYRHVQPIFRNIDSDEDFCTLHDVSSHQPAWLSLADTRCWPVLAQPFELWPALRWRGVPRSTTGSCTQGIFGLPRHPFSMSLKIQGICGKGRFGLPERNPQIPPLGPFTSSVGMTF